MRYLLIVFLLCSGWLNTSAQDCNLTLKGHVEDSDTKDQLSGATVIIRSINREVTTDDNGDFTFMKLCPGTYELEVTHVGCEPISQTVAIEKNTHIDLLLPHLKNNLQEVIVSGTKQLTNTGFKQELSGTRLEQASGLSLAEALAKLNGVTMLQTGSTIAKPVIHGLHSNRILTINNGVRQEGQQWGNEHAPEIDPFIADKLIVIKGVDELKYGSDAIGGVILVDPKPLRYLPGNHGEINTVYFTNNNEYVVSGVYEQQLKKMPAFSYRLQGTFKRGANVRTPDYRLNNTALQEENFSVTVGWKKEHYNLEAFYSQFHTKAGIFTGSHIGNLTDLKEAIAAPKPDDIFLNEKGYEISRPNQEVSHRLFKLRSNLYKGANKFQLTMAAQYNERKEYDIVRSSTNLKPQLNLSILTLTEDLSWEHPSVFNLKGTAGISFMQQDNSYTGRYFIPHYISATYGGYWLEKWKKEKWDIQAGIRYDYKAFSTQRLRNAVLTSHDFDFSTLGASLNTAYTIRPDMHVNVNLSHASRAPHVNELLSDGIHHGTATYEVGDINLSPEKSYNLSVGFDYANARKTFTAELTLYNNYIRDFIYQQPKPDEPVLTIAGAFPKIVYEQTNALLRGFDAAFSYHFLKQLALSSKASVLRAYNRNIDDWLISMPADRISNELVYTFKGNEHVSEPYVGLELANVFKQSRVPGDKFGKQDYKEPPPAYNLVNLNAAVTLRFGKHPFTLGAGVHNLLNTSYREYLNSFRYYVDEAGRNVQLRLKFSF
ncbi:TonB-dependent receptor [Flavitalea sp.]|nr:TonB-dependent receptor [Flavitalea sp.]